MKSQEAPKIVNASVWTAAIIGVLVFAVSLTTYFFGFLDNQISADTEDTLSDQPSQCPQGQMAVAINNYPGKENLIDGIHSGYYPGNSDMNFRCSHICVDRELSLEANSEKTLNADIGSLQGATINQEQPLISFASSDEFNKAIEKGGADKEKAIKYGFIVDKIRVVKGEGTGCLGPNSVPYGEIFDKDGKGITILDRPDTSYKEPALTKEDDIVAGEPAVESALKKDLTGADKPAGAPVPFGAPTGPGTETDTEKGGSDTNAQLQKCMKNVEGFIAKYGGAHKPTAPFFLAHYKYIQSKYEGLKKKVEAGGRDPERLLKACRLLESQIKNVTSATSATSSSTSATTQKQPSSSVAKTLNLNVTLKYNRKDKVNADTWVAIYAKDPNKNSFFDKTKPVPKPISDPILTYKYKKGESNFLTLQLAPTTLPDKLAIYAVTTGGFWSSERWGAQIIDFRSQDIIVDMDKKTGQKMTQGEYSIYYISYKHLENTRN